MNKGKEVVDVETKDKNISTSLIELVCPNHPGVKAGIDVPKKVTCSICGAELKEHRGI